MENKHDQFNEDHFLTENNRKNSFVLPRDYFNSLSHRILNRIEHDQELKAYNILSENRKQSFSIPVDYFESLAARIECAHELSAYPELPKLATPGLKVPEGYFTSSEKRLADKLELESELKEFAVLSSLPKKNSFKVAEGYFENVKENVQVKVHNERVTIFKQLRTVLFRPQMAIAASLVLVIGISVIWYLNRKNTQTLGAECLTLACLEKHEILNEKNIDDLDDESLYEMIDEAELDKALSDKTNNSDSIKTGKDQ